MPVFLRVPLCSSWSHSNLARDESLEARKAPSGNSRVALSIESPAIVTIASRSKAATRHRNHGERLSIRSLLQPHCGALTLGFIAIAGESCANLLQPWPLKIVLDDVLRAKETHGWAMAIVHRLVGADRIALLEFACA